MGSRLTTAPCPSISKVTNSSVTRSTMPLNLPFQPVGDGQLERSNPEAGFDLLDDRLEIGPDAIQLVDKGQPGDLVPIGLAPDRLRLGLHPADAAEDDDHSVQNPDGPLHLDGEIDVTGRVDDVDLPVLPMAGGRRRGDGDPPLLLLFHPVHDRLAVVDLADLVTAAGV